MPLCLRAWLQSLVQVYTNPLLALLFPKPRLALFFPGPFFPPPLNLDYITFKTLMNCGYMKNIPKLENDTYHFDSLNSYKFSKSKKLPKIVLNKT
jgi:hypothetical protein